MPSPYVREWHQKVVEEKGIPYPTSFEQAVQHSETHGIPIAPEYVAHFNDLTGEEMKTLCQHINVENKTTCGNMPYLSHSEKQTIFLK